jgi:hypothetical protein
VVAENVDQARVDVQADRRGPCRSSGETCLLMIRQDSASESCNGNVMTGCCRCFEKRLSICDGKATINSLRNFGGHYFRPTIVVGLGGLVCEQ